MSDGHENSQPAVNDAAIILLATAMAVLLSMVPVVFLLMWLKVVNPEYFRRNAPREEELPTTERPTNKPKHLDALFRRARAAVLKLRGIAIAAGGAIALRSREVVDEVRGRISELFGGRSRRCSDLPIMHQKSWQILAESHTERTFTSSGDDKVEHEVVEKPKKSAKTVHFDLGDEEDDTAMAIPVKTPEPAVVAESKTGS